MRTGLKFSSQVHIKITRLLIRTASKLHITTDQKSIRILLKIHFTNDGPWHQTALAK